ncbi:hypothetical protein D3C72_512950 [compost metagenome]
MKRIVIAGVAAWCMVGCASELPMAHEDPLIGSSEPYGPPSSVAPSSLPLVPLVVPGRDEMRLLPMRSDRLTLDSKADLDAFIARMSVSEHSGGPVSLPSRLSAIDFTKYQVVAFAEAGLRGMEEARIVGIEASADHRLVHTVRWRVASADAASGDSRARLHMVAVARSSKPITFLRTAEVPLAVTPTPVRPSPQVGVPWEPGPEPVSSEVPRWRAVPNPEVTEATVEAAAREVLKELAVTSLTVERRTIAWAVEQLQVGKRANWLPDSEVWVVKAEGGPTRLGPDGLSRVPVSGVSPRLVSLLFSIEDGMPLVSIGL